MRPVPPECSMCADVDGDGTVDMTDGVIVAAWASGMPDGAPCVVFQGDTLADGALTSRDASAIFFAYFSRIATTDGLCAPCDRACGDVDGDGMLTITDATLASEIGSEVRQLDVCSTWAADVDGDGDVDPIDATLLGEIVSLGGTASCTP